MSAFNTQDHAIGEIKGMVARLLVESERAEDERRQAREDRGKLYIRMEKMERSQERVEKKIDSQDSRLKAVEVPIENFSKWRERFIGMGLVWTVIAGGIGSAATYYWQKIIAMITG